MEKSQWPWRQLMIRWFYRSQTKAWVFLSRIYLVSLTVSIALTVLEVAAQGGTGLGLAIAKEIIKQHKGFIWAKSEYGKGSTFTIVLPYDKDAVKEEVWEDEVED